MLSTGILDLIVFILVLEILGFCVFPALAWMMPAMNDRGYGLSKIFGLFAFGAICWLLPAIGFASASAGMVTVVFAFFIFFGYKTFPKQGENRELLLGVLKAHVFRVEGIFIGLLLFFALIRFLNPEIFWGEKPMDSTFLQFFTRNEVLPPQDPWAAGTPMSYYYLGIYFIATLLKLTGIPAAVGFNLAISSLAGFIGSALYSLFIVLTRSKSFSFAAAIFVTVGSDPEVLNLCIIQGRSPSFDTFWASTRVFTSPFFFEYTSWSMLFADLHAHVIAIPFTILLLTFGLTVFLPDDIRFNRRGAARRFVLGAVWGALFGMNAWDFISYGIVLGVLVLFARITSFWKPPTNQNGQVRMREILFAQGFARAVSLLWDSSLIALGAISMLVPYSIASGTRNQIGWGWSASNEFNAFSQLFGMLGYWMIGTFFALFVLGAKCSLVFDRRVTVNILGSFLITIALFVLPIANSFGGAIHQPWWMLSYAVTTTCLCWIVFWRSTSSAEMKAIAALAIVSSILIVVLEELFIIDRMNTLFKGYIAIWMLMATSTCSAFYYAPRSEFSTDGRGARRLLMVIPGAVVCLSLVGAILNIAGILKLQRVPERLYTLDGSAYLQYSDPEDATIITWLNNHISGTPTILEAQGESYVDYTRISMHTGLPTVLGWEYHVQQRGVSYEEVARRKQAIKAIYRTTDLAVAKMLLLRNHVDLIVVSKLELRDYNGPGIRKFDENPDIFVPLFRSGTTAVYATYFSPLNPEYRGKL